MKNVMRYVLRDEAGEDKGGAGGAATPTWRDGLSDEYKDSPALKDFTDINGLVKSHIDTKAMVGKMVRIPGEDASQDDVKAFRDKLLSAELGVIPTPDLTNPEEAAAYYLKMGTPAEATGYSPVEGMDQGRFDNLSKLAHAAGISDTQFAMVASAMVTEGNASNDTIIAERTAGMDTLKSEWGEAYPEKYARAQRVTEALKAPQGLIDAVANNAVDAGTMRFLDAVAASIGGEGSNLIDLGQVTGDDKAELEHQRDELTRRLQSDERMPTAERTRLIAKNVDLNTRILALAS